MTVNILGTEYTITVKKYEEDEAFERLSIDGSWAKNEEMVDWIALQGPKIYKAWQEAGAL